MYRKTTRARIFALAVFLTVASGLGWTQADSGSQDSQNAAPPVETGQQSQSIPQPGPNNQLPPYQLNPPIVGLNVPSLAPPGVETRSFLIPGAQISQSVDTGQGDSNNSSIHGVTRGLGSLSLERLWRRYNFGLDYLGGAGYYSNRRASLASLQLLDVDQHISWSRGQFAIRDSFSYLPEGNFGAGSFGGTGALNTIGGLIGGLAGLGILGPGQFATFGEQPRITNVAIADVTQFLSPRSSVSAVGSYGLVHFTDDTLGLINSHQFVTQAAYDYQINKKNQIAVLYAYQTFRFPSVAGNNFDTNLVNVLFGRRINGRMQFVVGGGPQFTHIEFARVGNVALGASDRFTFSGRASLEYRLERSQLGLTFFRYETNGSGIFAGATTNVVRFTGSRPVSRRWNASADVGYSHNSRIDASIIGSSARSFKYIYAGASLHRQLGREFSGFVSYQFSNVGSDASLCVSGFSCSKTNQREVALIGLDWHPHPIRID